MPAKPEHPQATTILVLGILAIVLCPVFGIVAWGMGQSARSQVAAGIYAPSGAVTAGWILGIITTCILGLFVALMMLSFAV